MEDKISFFFFNGENEILVTEIGNHKQKNGIVTNINSPNRLEMRFGENLGWDLEKSGNGIYNSNCFPFFPYPLNYQFYSQQQQQI